MQISWRPLKSFDAQIAPRSIAEESASRTWTPVSGSGAAVLATAAFLWDWTKLLLYLYLRTFRLGRAWQSEPSSHFPLLFSGCDVNSPRQPGANGEGEEEARDGQTPLHLAASWGLEETVQCLLEFGANVNAQVRRIDGNPRIKEMSSYGRGTLQQVFWSWSSASP